MFYHAVERFFCLFKLHRHTIDIPAHKYHKTLNCADVIAAYVHIYSTRSYKQTTLVNVAPENIYELNSSNSPKTYVQAIAVACIRCTT